jgi:hypothetical protein
MVSNDVSVLAPMVSHGQKRAYGIRALKEAGGQPLHHDYPGVGHNCWDPSYAMPDLFEWLFQQRALFWAAMGAPGTEPSKKALERLAARAQQVACLQDKPFR